MALASPFKAAVSQWLLLHASSGAASELEADCPELNSAVKVQAKRVKLARLVALKAILELGFHPKVGPKVHIEKINNINNL